MSPKVRPARALALGTALSAFVGLASLQITAVSCGGGGESACVESFDGAIPNVDAGELCRFPCPVTTPSEGAAGDDYASFASGFFATYCVRCHSTDRPQNCFIDGDPTCRFGAPSGANWDDPASIRTHLEHVRLVVGVGEPITMPPDLPATPDPSKPAPSCEDRFRLVRWIDAGAPGLP